MVLKESERSDDSNEFSEVQRLLFSWTDVPTEVPSAAGDSHKIETKQYSGLATLDGSTNVCVPHIGVIYRWSRLG
jgi:hypothetical protein